MTNDLTKFHRLEPKEDHIWFTSRGRSNFVALDRPFKGKDASPDAKAKYVVSLVIAPEVNLKAFKDSINTVARAKWGNEVDLFTKGKTKGLKNPLIDPTEKDIDPALFGLESLEGYTIIRPTSINRPPVIGMDGKEIDPDEIKIEAYSGRKMRLEIKVKEYDAGGGKGVTCYLERVQLLGHAPEIKGAGGPKRGAGELGAVQDEDEIDSEDALS